MKAFVLFSGPVRLGVALILRARGPKDGDEKDNEKNADYEKSHAHAPV